jgi:hypothetical protein
MIVRIDEMRLHARKGSFSTHALLNDFKERIRWKGYQSRIKSTTGRLTAIGLLRRESAKKAREAR